MQLQTHIPYVAQSPPTSQASGITVSPEMLFFGGVGLLLGVFKWLIGREISRLDSTLKELGDRLKQQEDWQASQQVEAATIARMEREMAQMERQLTQITTDLATLGKVGTAQDRMVEALGELRERVQRADNIGSALFQAQDLIKEIQKELLQFKSHVAAGFVTEEKFVRDMTVLSSRVDAVWERFDQVAGSRPRLLEGGEGGYR